jgi:hypothetical protein
MTDEYKLKEWFNERRYKKCINRINSTSNIISLNDF